MNKKRLLYSLVVFIIIGFLCLPSVSAQRQVDKKERIKIIRSQLNTETTELLGKLQSVFTTLSKINSETYRILKAVSPMAKEKNLKILSNLKNQAKHALKVARLKGKYSRRLKDFIDSYFEDTMEFNSLFANMRLEYEKCASLYSLNNKETLSTHQMASYRYYSVCLDGFQKKFGVSLDVSLKYLIEEYKNLALLAKQKDIIEINRLLEKNINSPYFDSILEHLNTEIIEKMRLTNKTMVRSAILRALYAVREQVEFDKFFSKALIEKLKTLSSPAEPTSPDLQVIAIEIVPEGIPKIGKKVTLHIDIKNAGDISTKKTIAKIIFPDGSHIIKSIPILSAKKIQKLKVTHKLNKEANNTFIVIVNPDLVSWENNTNNNEVKRTLILP